MLSEFVKPLVVAVASFALLVTGAGAADGTQVVVTAGTLSITNPAAADFASRTIDGTAQTTTASLDAFTVTDATGSGAGWRVTAQASQFTYVPAVGTTRTLAAGSLSVSTPTVAANGTTSPDPTVSAGPFTIDVASAVQVASAAVDTGMGAYDFGATTMTLSLPADVYAGTYTSTVTISVVSAP